jgi:hypothetical protein
VFSEDVKGHKTKYIRQKPDVKLNTYLSTLTMFLFFIVTERQTT